MKNTLIALAALLVFASCSAPKYSYYFDQYDYQAGKRKQAAASKTQEVAILATEIPVAIPQEELVLASGEKDLSMLKINRASAAPKVKSAKHAVSREERKQIRKQVMSALKAYKKEVRKASPDAPAGGDRNQIVALILAILLGGLGIHRFYLGHTMTAIAQILLLILAIIIPILAYLLLAWVLYDIVMIAIGKLKPANGSYNPSF